MKRLSLILGLVALCRAGVLASDVLSYSHVQTITGLERFDLVLATADFDGDGADDVLAGFNMDFVIGNRSLRTQTGPIFLLISNRDGTFRDASSAMFAQPVRARQPVAVPGDFNRDGRMDVAIFDAGIYEPGAGGFGNPPMLLLSGVDGRLHPSSALSDAVLQAHNARYPQFAGSRDLHIKTARAGDVDSDGDLDMWVESCGGSNMNSHFMINNGNGTFTADESRVAYTLLHNPQPEFWRHFSSALVDLNGDARLDLVLGQMRDLDPTHINQSSLVLMNDGTGHFPQRLLLPQPDFNGGYTEVHGLAASDINGDGMPDLVLLHQRNDDGPAGVEPFTGRYLQILIRQGSQYVDETAARMGDQSRTTAERNEEGYPLANNAEPAFLDVNRDGRMDLVMVRQFAPIRDNAPLVYLKSKVGTFKPVAPDIFTGGDRYFGNYSMPLHLDRDGILDFVTPVRLAGPDGIWGNGDDVFNLTALVAHPSPLVFTDDPIVAGKTSIRLVHLTELRSRIDAVRAVFNLPPYAWSDPALTAGASRIRAGHITDLRTALVQAYTAARMTTPTFTDDGLTGVTVKAVHLAEIRTALAAIE